MLAMMLVFNYSVCAECDCFTAQSRIHIPDDLGYHWNSTGEDYWLIGHGNDL